MSSDAFWWPGDDWPPDPAARRANGDALYAPYLWKLHQIEYRQLSDNLDELKGRVARVEATLVRGILLLVANLAAVLATLATAYLGP